MGLCIRSYPNQRINRKFVFVSNKPLHIEHPHEFVPVEHITKDDELVHALLPHFSSVASCKTMSFNGFLHNMNALFLFLSGASHGYVSEDFVQARQLSCQPVRQMFTRLADDSAVCILGVVRGEIKHGTICAK